MWWVARQGVWALRSATNGPRSSKAISTAKHRESSCRSAARGWRARTQPTWATPIVAHVRAGRGRSLVIVARDLPPQEDQRHAHDHVARHHHAVVQRAAAHRSTEHRLQSERKHDDADHLHHRRQAEDPVVGVVGRREPRVVQPRPGDGERGEGEPEDARADVVLGDVVGQFVGGRAEGDDDGQVVEQLQRGRCAVVLMRVATAEPPSAMGPAARRLAVPWQPILTELAGGAVELALDLVDQFQWSSKRRRIKPVTSNGTRACGKVVGGRLGLVEAGESSAMSSRSVSRLARVAGSPTRSATSSRSRARS